jgi:alkylation response protein AidB-like acyl-CoA dehydrogenase
MAHAGFTKSFIPADYGGAGFSMLDLAIAAEELTCVDVSVPTTLLATGLGLQPVIQFGTPEQKERFLRPFADDPEGDLLASYAFTDVAGGANFDSADPAGGMQTIARRDGDEWVITGEKHYTTNGTGWDRKGCELYTVVCRTDPAAGADDALAVIAVPGSVPGISVVDVYDKIGHRGVVTPRVHFDAVRVPAANLIRPDGQTGRHRRVRLDGGADRRGLRRDHARGLRIRAGLRPQRETARHRAGHRAPECRLHARRHQDADRGLPLSRLEGVP